MDFNVISKISVKFELLIGHTILSYFFWCSLLAHLHSRLRFDQNQSLETRKWIQNALLWALHSDFQFCYKLELLLSKINLYILLLGRPCNAFFYFSVHCLHSKPIYLTRIGPQTHPKIDFVTLIIYKAHYSSAQQRALPQRRMHA